jgi:hypothetical protein
MGLDIVLHVFNSPTSRAIVAGRSPVVASLVVVVDLLDPIFKGQFALTFMLFS